MNVQTMLATQAQQALAHQSGDYVSKDVDEQAYIQELMDLNGLETVYRFDIGKNTDGVTPLIRGMLTLPELADTVTRNIVEYPDNHFRHLKRQIAMRHGIDPQWLAFGAGLESVIDQICRAVIEPDDKALIPVPNFSVFEDMSRRCGAEILPVSTSPPDYRWTAMTTRKIVEHLHRDLPKVIWISNPVNPTGQYLPLSVINEVCENALHTGTLVVVDEAYGEYADRDDAVVSASRLLQEHPHLMVLRTFSKMYALPSARVGYLMCSTPELLRAVDAFRPTFPLPWSSLHTAQIAIMDDPYVCACRRRTEQRRKRLLPELESITGIVPISSQTNTVMFRHRSLPARELADRLAAKGFLTANLNNVTGIENRGFLRMTVRSGAENALFVKALAAVAN
ncbi:pyridoxal phosphate-dependent aminotransferase [Salidesulfovibrio brasiliensis]|uniref:pyridoxal phosphate-dependent aminotransferase n=1 Tax=Salidesulfovibrio brasiliensis TaxID=221711 RepID=UPI0006D2AC00|nr:histidinol-phosphate transaminase [Salidesulfovibrio brasiliensis]